MYLVANNLMSSQGRTTHTLNIWGRDIYVLLWQ